MTDKVSAKIVILLGPPGAGKGTQAALVSKSLGIPHISTGDIMRAAIKENSELGIKVKKYLDDGVLVPDALVTDVIKERISRQDCDKGFLLDGFPRTGEQALQLNTLLAKMGCGAAKVVDISVPEQVLIDRIKKRGEQGSGRSDDNAEMAAKRLQVYRNETAPLTDFYKKAGNLREVDGLGTVEQVNERILSAIS